MTPRGPKEPRPRKDPPSRAQAGNCWPTKAWSTSKVPRGRIKDASRIASPGNRTRGRNRRAAQRAPPEPRPSHRPLHLGVRPDCAARDPDCARRCEYAAGEAELGRRHRPRVAGLDRPRGGSSRLAAGSRHQRRLPATHAASPAVVEGPDSVVAEKATSDPHPGPATASESNGGPALLPWKS